MFLFKKQIKTFYNPAWGEWADYYLHSFYLKRKKKEIHEKANFDTTK
jgi:CRISPR/Cas system-associated protein Csx1